MKKYFALLIGLQFVFHCLSQSFDVKSSDEVSVKGSVYMKPLMRDESGIYFLKMENKSGKSCLYALDKYDKNMNNVYDNCIEKYTGDKIIQNIVTVQNRIYVFFSEWTKKKFAVYGLELDKATGNPVGKEKLLVEWILADRMNRYDLRIKPDADSSNSVITATSDSPADDAYHIILVDVDLNVKYYIKADPKFNSNQVFEFENVITENSNSAIITGKLYDIVRSGKNTSWVLNRLVIQRYDVNEKKLADLNPDLKDKYIISYKVFRIANTTDIFISGIYSKTNTGVSIPAGLFFSKLAPDLTLGNVSIKEINPADIEKWKAEEKYPGIYNFIFYDILFDKDKNRLFLFAETYDYKQEYGTYWYHDPIGRRPGQQGYVASQMGLYKNAAKKIFTYVYHCGEMIVIDVDLKSSSINKYYNIDKKQVEIIAENEDNNFPAIYDAFVSRPPTNYIYGQGVAPFYSSFSTNKIGERLFIIYNQQEKIQESKRSKDKDDYPDFNTSQLNCISINLNSGEVTKKIIAANDDDHPVYMPRFAYASGNDFLIPALKITRKLKADCKFVRVAIKD